MEAVFKNLDLLSNVFKVMKNLDSDNCITIHPQKSEILFCYRGKIFCSELELLVSKNCLKYEIYETGPKESQSKDENVNINTDESKESDVSHESDNNNINNGVDGGDSSNEDSGEFIVVQLNKLCTTLTNVNKKFKSSDKNPNIISIILPKKMPKKLSDNRIFFKVTDVTDGQNFDAAQYPLAIMSEAPHTPFEFKNHEKQIQCSVTLKSRRYYEFFSNNNTNKFFRGDITIVITKKMVELHCSSDGEGKGDDDDDHGFDGVERWKLDNDTNSENYLNIKIKKPSIEISADGTDNADSDANDKKEKKSDMHASASANEKFEYKFARKYIAASAAPDISDCVKLYFTPTAVIVKYIIYDKKGKSAIGTFKSLICGKI